jgi:hypothetical protein
MTTRRKGWLQDGCHRVSGRPGKFIIEDISVGIYNICTLETLVQLSIAKTVVYVA